MVRVSMNWIWISIVIGNAHYFLRRGHGALGGARGGHLLEGIEHRGRGSERARGVAGTGLDAEATAPELVVDPVAREPVHASQALTSLYQVRVSVATANAHVQLLGDRWAQVPVGN